LGIWDRIKNNYHLTDILKSIIFYRNTLRLCYEKTQVKISLSPLFIDVPNFFNDALPDLEYFDLSGIIEKYSLLNPKKTIPVLQKWKVALEKVQVYLGEIESNKTYDPQLRNVLENFQLGLENESLIQLVTYTPKLKNDFMDFNCIIKDITEEKLYEISLVAQAVSNLYEIKDIHSGYWENALPIWQPLTYFDVKENGQRVDYRNEKSDWKGITTVPLHVGNGQEVFRWCVEVLNVGDGNLGMIGAIPGGKSIENSHFSSCGGGIYQPSNSQVYAQWKFTQRNFQSCKVGSKVLFEWYISSKFLIVIVDGVIVAEFYEIEDTIQPCICFHGKDSSARFVPVD